LSSAIGMDPASPVGEMPEWTNRRWPAFANADLHEGADLAVVADCRDVPAERLTGHISLANAARVFPGHAAMPLGPLE
jgi:hypothetical protein